MKYTLILAIISIALISISLMAEAAARDSITLEECRNLCDLKQQAGFEYYHKTMTCNCTQDISNRLYWEGSHE